MEGEQKVDLPLNGELDIKSSDMLVSVNSAKLAHNRQRWQGHCLPSSLRYEHDGWAAGWDVYNVNYDDKDIKVESVLGTTYTVRRYLYNDNKTFKIAILDEHEVEQCSFLYNDITVAPDDVLISTDNNIVYKISFNIDSQPYDIYYNILTNEVVDKSSNISVTADYTEKSSVKVSANDLANTTDVSVNHITLPTNISLSLGNNVDAVTTTMIGKFDNLTTEGKGNWHSSKYASVLQRDGDNYKLTTKHVNSVNDKKAWADVPVYYDSTDGYYKARYSGADYFTIGGSAIVSLKSNNTTSKIVDLAAMQVHQAATTFLENNQGAVPSVFNNWGVEEVTDKHNITAYLPMHITVVIKYMNDDTIAIFENDRNVTNDYVIDVDVNGVVTIRTATAWLGTGNIIIDTNTIITAGAKEYLYNNRATWLGEGKAVSMSVTDLLFTNMKSKNGTIILDVTRKGYVSCDLSSQGLTMLLSTSDTATGRLYIDRDRNSLFTLSAPTELYADNTGGFITRKSLASNKYVINSAEDYALYYTTANVEETTAFVASVYDRYINDNLSHTSVYTCKANTAIVPEYDENGELVNNYNINYNLWGTFDITPVVLTTYNMFATTYSKETTTYINEYTESILPTVCSTFGITFGDVLTIDDNNITQQFSISTAGSVFKGIATYSRSTMQLNIDTANLNYNGYTQSISCLSDEILYSAVDIQFEVIGNTYTVIQPFSMPTSTDDNISIVSADTSAIIFSTRSNARSTSDKAYEFRYHDGIVIILDSGVVAKDVSFSRHDSTNVYTLTFNYTPHTEFELILFGPTNAYKCSLEYTVTDTTEMVAVTFDNDTVGIDMHEVLALDDSTMQYIATDIRDKDLAEKSIVSIKQNNELQIVKQFWNTTTQVEQFWWLNKDHVLTLDKFNFNVSRKLNTVDDWNGDKWEVIKTIPRINLLQSDVTKHFVSSVYGDDTAVYCTMRVISTKQMELSIYDMLSDDLHANRVVLTVVQRNLGEPLIAENADPSVLYTYTVLRADTILSQAKVTSTLRNGVLLVGIHFDNNFNQWTVVIEGDTATQCVQGYGFVGPDGSLTGGEIPTVYFNEHGFSGTVEDIDKLGNNADATEEISYINTLAELQNIDARVYGNDVQQWYVSKNIDSIVSHIKCTDKDQGVEFVPVPLYINNNYNVIYNSASFASQVLGDSNGLYETTLFDLLGIKDGGGKLDFASLFGNLELRTGWDYDTGGPNNDVFNQASMPMNVGTSGRTLNAFKRRIGISQVASLSNFPIYDMRPLLSNINYLQQTIGQYAYVHYNSSNVKVARNIQTSENDNRIDNTLTTASNSITQIEQASLLRENQNKFGRPVGTDELAFDTQVVRQVQSCESAWPRDFLAILSVAMSALDFTTSLLQLNQSSNEVSVAGMNNGSQLMSQALNSLSLSSLQPQMLIPTQISEVPAIKTLDMFYSTSKAQHVYAGPGFVNHNFVAQCTAQSVTSLQLELKQEKLEWVIKLLTEAETMALQVFFSLLQEAFTTLGTIFSTHFWVGMMCSIFSAGCAILAATYTRRLNSMESILNALGGDRPKFTVTAALSKHAYDVEGKHKYGNSSKSFMWPCFGCTTDVYTDEYVSAIAQNKSWRLNTPTAKNINDIEVLSTAMPNDDNVGIDSFVTDIVPDNASKKFSSDIPYYIAMCKGNMQDRQLPDDMAYIIGTESFLSKDAFKNENIGEDDPVFTAPLTQDYMLSARWELGITATAGETAWMSVRDTKILDGEPSNIIISNDFCGVSSTYAALEVKRGISKKYMRPVTITPTALAFNCTGYNCIFDEKAYHGFDGYGSRIVSFVGTPGMSKEHLTLLYAFLVNDRFKRSNKIAPNQLLGNFKAAPVLAMNVLGDDKVYSQCTLLTENEGMSVGVPGEDKDALRYALPVFSEYVNTLPAATKTLSTYTFAIVDGITSLTTDIRNTLTAYKVPISVDFNINTESYRATQEYICKLTNKNGAVSVDNLVPILGLSFIGASPYEAYFYSQATKLYYVYTGGTSISAVDTIERFRDVQKGYWDFVNQEVVMPCVATFDRLDSNVHDDDDETDNIIIPVLKNQTFSGEVAPPVTTIFNNDSWYKTYSLPSGVVYQGPNRCIINRFVWSDYMLKSVRDNRGKWLKVLREQYHPFRKYNRTFTSVTDYIGTEPDVVKGWTHNPFLLVTSPLGVNEETDCKFEWEITFAWTVEMDKLYAADEYACVNIVAETMAPGGKIYSRPSHVYLTKELFTRTGNYGYYSFRYQSNNGMGNRERLHVWADSYIAISSVQCAYKVITEKRSEILTQQIDVKGLQEM